MKIWREKRGFVSCETLTPDILPYTNPWDTQFSHKHIPCPCRALWTIRYLGTYPGAPAQSLHGKGRVRTPLLIHNCNVKDRDWQSWLAGETILGEKFNQVRAAAGCSQAGPSMTQPWLTEIFYPTIVFYLKKCQAGLNLLHPVEFWQAGASLTHSWLIESKTWYLSLASLSVLREIIVLVFKNIQSSLTRSRDEGSDEVL